MKKISKLLAGCCFVVSMFAHVQEKLDCEFNFKEALSYVQLFQDFKKDSLKVMNLLRPCLKKGDAKAQLLMGRLYAVNGDEKSYRKAFKLFKKSAKQGNAIATGDLRAMYKYGRGCNLNFNKARKWFKKGAELGNSRASYSLGYIYLKGLGNVDQDYTKAIKWFQKSQHPMAKYWLGVCNYYGYGIKQNIKKANELLGTNFEAQINGQENSISTENSTENISNVIDVEESINSEKISESNIFGKWSGSLLQYDWSGKHIEQKFPVHLEFLNNDANDFPTYTISIENQELKGSLTILNDAIYFEDAQLNLSHISFNEKIPTQLNHEILSSDLMIKTLAETDYLVGNIDTYIEGWNESGAPMKFVLKKKEIFTNSEEELSDDILQALAEQEESFIKLYPNPFESDLIISYTLKSSSFVEVRISDVKGTKSSVIEKGKEQKKG